MMPSVRGFRGYESSHDILMLVDGEWLRIGFVACGGAHVGGTICVDLSGKGCAVVTDWASVFATMQKLQARITRCDLAMDFLAGEVSVGQVEQMYFGGEFNCGGRVPSYRKIESGSASARGCGGTTFEIGRRVNGKLVRAYEKGRQLGKQDSAWVRVEIEFGNKDRVIPHEIVLKRNEYFVGAHKALERFIDVASLRCRTDQMEHETVLDVAVAHASRQYGKVFHQVLQDNGNDFAALVQRITVVGVPNRMQKTALARHVFGAHEPAPPVWEFDYGTAC
jgi:phage replication initiation protein